jgi:hypothetical protein
MEANELVPNLTEEQIEESKKQIEKALFYFIVEEPKIQKENDKKNEIKKELYKQKPISKFDFLRKKVLYYSTVLNGETIRFEIPVEDLGDAQYTPEMESQLLIRYLVK